MNNLLRGLAVFAAAAFCSASCISVNSSLGENYIASRHQYDIHTAEFNLEDIRMSQADSLSGFSTYKFAVGSIRENDFGLTKRAAAFSLVPMAKNLDFGKEGTREFKDFRVCAISDSVSVYDLSQERILQAFNVYELSEAINMKRSCQEIKHGGKKITGATPIYNGRDSLVIVFNKEFGEKYLTIKEDDLKDLETFTKKFPGIYIDMDAPASNGGRINMFKLPIGVVDGYIQGSYATLKFSAEYEDRGKVDTTFFFCLGPADIYDFSNVSSTTTSTYPQVAYNITDSGTRGETDIQADKTIIFEGGYGLKPIINAEPVRDQFLAELGRKGIDPSTVTISKATIELPFEFPENYKDMTWFPRILSPTCRIVKDDGSTLFANITDSSVSSENQGDINRSRCMYSPDISHHIQELVRLKDLTKIHNYDIWFLPTRVESISEGNQQSQTSQEMADMYSQLAYQSYYQNYMGGGYGGYGYGGYGGYGYNNYYTYSMLAQQYASAGTGSTASKVNIMDTFRFYKAVLNGPNADGAKPKVKITYAVTKTK